jgi:hypothetical protein
MLRPRALAYRCDPGSPVNARIPARPRFGFTIALVPFAAANLFFMRLFTLILEASVRDCLTCRASLAQARVRVRLLAPVPSQGLTAF